MNCPTCGAIAAETLAVREVRCVECHRLKWPRITPSAAASYRCVLCTLAPERREAGKRAWATRKARENVPDDV